MVDRLIQQAVLQVLQPLIDPTFSQHSRRWWHNSALALNSVLTIAYFDRLGMPRLTCPQLLEPPGADPYAGWCGREQLQKLPLMPMPDPMTMKLPCFPMPLLACCSPAPTSPVLLPCDGNAHRHLLPMAPQFRTALKLNASQQTLWLQVEDRKSGHRARAACAPQTPAASLEVGAGRREHRIARPRRCGRVRGECAGGKHTAPTKTSASRWRPCLPSS